MMKTRSTIFMGVLIGFFLWSLPVTSQVKYVTGPKPELKVSGTSTLHDWEMISDEATGEALLVLEEGKLQGVEKLSLQMPAESIKSGKNGMDKNTYAALNTKKYKEVRFVLSKITPAGANTWKAEGNFTIAGVTRPAAFEVKSSPSGADYRFQGKHPFKLTDYKIDPPTAIFGTVKTGNEVAIHFDITLQPAQ